MTPEPAQVPGAGNAGGVPAQAGTPNAAGSVAAPAATPSTPTVDADAFRKAQEDLAKAQHDINAVKSTFQKREAELLRQADQQRRDYEEQLQQRTLATMDDDEREKYLSSFYKTRADELEAKQAEYEAKIAQAENYNASLNYFVDKGVPLASLDRSGDVQALVQSGYDYLSNRVKELEAKIANPGAAPTAPATPPPAAPPAAPRVDTNTGAPAAVVGYAEQWAALIEKYGSMERVFKLVELRQLSPKVIPVKPE